MVKEVFESVGRSLDEIKNVYARLDTGNKEDCYTTLSAIRKHKNRIVCEIEKIEDGLIDKINGKYYVGKLIVAKEDCMKNFKEAQVVEITGIEGDFIDLDSVARVHVNFIDRYFN